MEGLWSVIGIAAGAALVFFILRPRVTKAEAEAAAEREKAGQADSARQKLDVELATVRVEANRAAEVAGALNDRDLTIRDLERQNSAMSTTIAEREAALAAERDQLNILKGQFKTQFAELSANALKENSETFLDTARRVLALQHKEADTDLQKRQEEIKQLVKPIQDGIKAVGDAAKEMENKREKAFGTIEEQLKQSVMQATEVARQTGCLKDALKRPNVRGRWGEVQLKNCIDLAGMEEHCDVEFQESSVSLDDERVRPDMIVRMPGGRKIAVDAKTPMDPFLDYINATTDDARNAALIRHGGIVKAHITKLASRDYMQKVAESPDFVVMFLPNESFLAMALEREPTLMEDGLNKKVLVTTPGTLIGLLKVVRYGWNEEKIGVNAQLIADEGAKLNTEITNFLEGFAKLGRSLKAASEAYDESERRMQKQISNSATKLTQLGAKSRKALTPAAARMLTPGESESTEIDANAEEAT
jgi:DNA recombination protein RmuC